MASSPNLTQTFQRLQIDYRNALQREGEHPSDILSRAETINMYALTTGINKTRVMGTEIMRYENVISHHYPPSVASFTGLKNIMIRDLSLETHHRGSYLKLRFVCSAIRASAVMNVVEDETGTVLRFALYFQLPENVRSADSILKNQAVIILKEPYFKVETDGQYEIRVDHPTDIIWLLKDDARIPVTWRTATDVSESAEYWKKKGNDQVKKDNFFGAVEMYTTALHSSPTFEEQDILHNNRAHANLKIEAFDAALDDASFIRNPQDRSEKGLYRSALALYGLRRYTEAIELLQILIKNHSGNKLASLVLKRCQRRLAEAETGQYDFVKLYEATKLRPPLMDNASYIGPVEVRESAGRGRGLFITRSVKAGEMILCEKAFAYCFATPPEEMDTTASKKMSVLSDLPGDRRHVGSQADLVRDVVNKLILNPSLAPSFENLYHGEAMANNYVTNTSIDGSRVLDAFLVAKTSYINSFGCRLTSRNEISTPELDQASGYTATKEHSVDSGLITAGIWTMTSHINHACNPNCMRSFIGDLLIIRATNDMPAMTELTICYITHENPTLMNTKLSRGWGFRCTCAVCVEDRETPNATKASRQRLIEAFNANSLSIAGKREVLGHLRATYQHPSTEIPRLDMVKLHDSLVCDAWVEGEGLKSLLEELLACFESLGFIIEGAGSTLTTNPKIVVRKWGYPCPGNYTRWVTLRRLYRTMGQFQLAEQAEKFARISWMMLVGEDTTFVI